jgi:hypothetical protein
MIKQIQHSVSVNDKLNNGPQTLKNYSFWSTFVWILTLTFIFVMVGKSLFIT